VWSQRTFQNKGSHEKPKGQLLSGIKSSECNGFERTEDTGWKRGIKGDRTVLRIAGKSLKGKLGSFG